MRMPVTVSMIMVVMVVFQQEHAYDIHRKTNTSDDNRFIKVNGLRVEQTMYRFHQHQQSHNT